MTEPIATGNEEQSRHWNEVAGPLWVERRDLLDRMIGAFGHAVIEHAAPTAGERVLDVGCGTGQTTVEIARRVQPGGGVVGIDISRPMLESARQRAADAGVAAAVELRLADVQVASIEAAAFDLVFSRFGVMFFADPVAAFTNLRGALKPSGRLIFLCWQGLARNPWVAGPMQALAAVLPMPAPPPPGAPGPFAFGDQSRVEDILRRAGFHGVGFEEVERRLVVGDGGVESTLELLMRIGPCATLLKDAPAETVETARGALREFFSRVAENGEVTLLGKTWIVSARPQ